MTRMVAVARRHPRSHRRSRSQRGLGGSSYIDSVVLRDRDADTSWRSAGDGTLEERRYYAQNWRADVSVILPSTGCDASSGPGILEWVKYSAYGTPQAFSMADYNRDGAVNGSDFNGTTGAFDVDYAASDPRADVNFDGGVTIDDYLLFINAASEAAGRGTQSCASTSNRIGYAGYQWDPVIGANHVRHRVYLPELGRWTRRDPLGYVDGMTLFEYARSSPSKYLDASGLGPVEDCQAAIAACESDPRIQQEKQRIRDLGGRVPDPPRCVPGDSEGCEGQNNHNTCGFTTPHNPPRITICAGNCPTANYCDTYYHELIHARQMHEWGLFDPEARQDALKAWSWPESCVQVEYEAYYRAQGLDDPNAVCDAVCGGSCFERWEHIGGYSACMSYCLQWAMDHHRQFPRRKPNLTPRSSEE
jgi:RHS repeat-associated protein